MLANYNDQLAQFLEARCQRPILFFRGEAGTGKTTLLRACLNEVPSHIQTIRFNFKTAGGISVAEIFFRVAGDIGRQRMKLFNETVGSRQGQKARKSVTPISPKHGPQTCRT
jgi:hypothetical protein